MKPEDCICSWTDGFGPICPACYPPKTSLTMFERWCVVAFLCVLAYLAAGGR